jgi:hypothetical protein
MMAVLSASALAEASGQVGQRLPTWPWNSATTEDAIRHFALGIGDDNPLWWDREYAEQSGAGSYCAPPTFLYSCISSGPWPSGHGEGVPEILPGALSLWAQDSWIWKTRLPADRKVTVNATVASLEERTSKRGDLMIAQTERYVFTTGETPVAELYRTIMRMEPRGSAERQVDVPVHVYSAGELDEIARQ